MITHTNGTTGKSHSTPLLTQLSNLHPRLSLLPTNLPFNPRPFLRLRRKLRVITPLTDNTLPNVLLPLFLVLADMSHCSSLPRTARDPCVRPLPDLKYASTYGTADKLPNMNPTLLGHDPDSELHFMNTIYNRIYLFLSYATNIPLPFLYNPRILIISSMYLLYLFHSSFSTPLTQPSTGKTPVIKHLLQLIPKSPSAQTIPTSPS